MEPSSGWTNQMGRVESWWANSNPIPDPKTGPAPGPIKQVPPGGGNQPAETEDEEEAS
jgi:hypothetical protein